MKLFPSYIPLSDASISVWLGTYKEKLGQLGASLGLTEADIEEQRQMAQALIDNIGKVDLKKAELREAVAGKEHLKQTYLQQIRNMAIRVKRTTAYTVQAGKELGIVSNAQLVDQSILKPVINAVSYPGYVSISFRKQGMFGISVYTRLKGQQEWQFLGIAKSGPLADESPLAESDKPEMREYMARGYDGIDEVGYASDIVTIIHGG